MIRVVSFSILLLASLAVPPAGAQNFGAPTESHFRLEWEVGPPREGVPTIRGYVYNLRSHRMRRVKLLVETLDAGGRPVASTVAPVDSTTIAASDRAYFDVPAPAPGPAYRVSIYSFEWDTRGTALLRPPWRGP